MTQKISTGLANMLLEGGGDIKTIFPAFRIRILDAVPLHADDDEPTLLCELTVGGDGTTDLTFDAAADMGVLLKNPAEAWQGTNVSGGECRSWRLVLPTDTHVSSTTEPRIQGTIGMSGKDIIVADPVFGIAEVFTLANFYQAFKIG